MSELFSKKLAWGVALIIFALLSCANLGLAAPAPKIWFTKVSPYGDANGYAWGKASGVSASNYVVLTYLEVEHVWWTKPSLAAPATNIAAHGAWKVDITTGGIDQCATRVLVFLVPKTTDLTKYQCAPCCGDITIPEAVASAMYDRTPTPKTLSFSNYQWNVRRSNCQEGPGPNYFSDAPSRVWVDKAGLHLTITKGSSGRWYNTQVTLNQSLGYGVYRMVTNSRIDTLNENVVAGLFTYDYRACDDQHRELDFEFTRWGNASEYTNAQVVVQPCDDCPGCGGNCERFRVDLTNTNKVLTHYLIWSPARVEFKTYKGKFGDTPPADSYLVHRWIYDGPDLPVPGEEKFMFNLWLNGGTPPSNGRNAQLLISEFLWQPLPVEEPGLYIDGASTCGDLNGAVWGHVSGLDYAQYQVEVFIQVCGGWWTRPYGDQPFTSIASNGTWTCDITTGGQDQTATQVAAFLVPKGTPARVVLGDATLPAQIYTDAVDHKDVTRPCTCLTR